MTKIEINNKNDLERALRTFKTKVRREGIIDEMKKREFYEKPSQRRRKKEEKAKVNEQRRRRRQDDM